MLNSDYSLTFGVAASNLVFADTCLFYHKLINPCQVVQVRPFRARKKTSISSEPAPPMADKCKGIERIKTDYNSYLYTLCGLIVLNINNLYEIALIGAGYGCL